MTVPSKIWMRSLSPSTTRTCTFTVSPGRNAGRSLRSCSASMRSSGLMNLKGLPGGTNPVKDDGRRAADGEVVVVAGSLDRLEPVVAPGEHLGGEAPARAEDEQYRLRVAREPSAEGLEGQAAGRGARGGRHHPREPAGLAFDVGDGGFEVRDQSDERQGLAS